MVNVLVIGANRGIGLEVCRQFHARGDNVYATSRGQSDDLSALGVNAINNVDVTDDASIVALADALEGLQIDILLNNAGILTRETLNDLDFDRIRKQFEVNTLGPLRVIHALGDNLVTGSRVGIITSRVGSIEDNGSGGIYGYRISKAAANMVGKNLSRDLAEQGIAVILLHPGLVATDMTGGNGIEPSAAAKGIVQRLDDLTMDTTGTFWHAEGYQLPW
jgi:NAD(P)-dependent dehydrogenase (short-subunit alcohol dehydrogenase family)